MKSTKDDRDLDTPKTNSKRKRTPGKEKVCTNLDSVMSYVCTHIIQFQNEILTCIICCACHLNVYNIFHKTKYIACRYPSPPPPPLLSCGEYVCIYVWVCLYNCYPSQCLEPCSSAQLVGISGASNGDI